MTLKDYKKRKRGYWIASVLLMAITLIFYIVYGYVTSMKTSSDSSVVKDIIIQLIPYGLTAIMLLVATIFISNKLRTTVWMGSVIIGTLFLGRTALIITFALWALDEYFLWAKFNKYKLKTDMAKTIDEYKK